MLRLWCQKEQEYWAETSGMSITLDMHLVYAKRMLQVLTRLHDPLAQVVRLMLQATVPVNEHEAFGYLVMWWP